MFAGVSAAKVVSGLFSPILGQKGYPLRLCHTLYFAAAIG
jgi:hypothetical protein